MYEILAAEKAEFRGGLGLQNYISYGDRLPGLAVVQNVFKGLVAQDNPSIRIQIELGTSSFGYNSDTWRLRPQVLRIPQGRSPFPLLHYFRECWQSWAPA